MSCYYCEQRHPGGTNFGASEAIGICQHCGVGVCLKHSDKGSEPGAPLLCPTCAALRQATERQPAVAQSEYHSG